MVGGIVRGAIGTGGYCPLGNCLWGNWHGESLSGGDTSDIFTIILLRICNGNFPKGFKISEVIPVYRKHGSYDKNNQMKYMYDEINAYFDDTLSNFICGFRKCYSAQHCLLYMIKEIRKIIDSKGVFVAVLTYLSKAFDCISHELNIINYFICLFEPTRTEN